MSSLDDLAGRIERREAEIGVVGLGYVGLPLALAFARAGFRVTGIDRDGEKIRSLEQGRSWVPDVPDAELEEPVRSGRLRATTSFEDLTRADVIHVCVPTPLSRTRDPDFSDLVAAMHEVRRRLRSGQLVVLGSTTYPGTTHELFRPLLEETGLRAGSDFALAFAPERIDPGNREFSLRDVPKVVGGETEACTRVAEKMFGAVFERVVPVSSSQAAEMVKLLENTFRMINIGLANEVSRICDRLGLDVWEVIDAAATKPYGFMRFEPGPGIGGHCIPVDPSYLAWKLRSLNYRARFIDLAAEVNGEMPGWVVERVGRILNRDRLAVNGSRILLLGVAYKADVADVRESPAIDILLRLADLGAVVDYHDPHIPEIAVAGRSFKSVTLSEEALEGADLVVITTAHRGVDYERVACLAPWVLDTRNALRGQGPFPNVERL
jgi:UDP-N-acetyl-D-glucosamine dehydrogenase